MRLTLARTAGKIADVARYLAPVDEGDYARKIYVASGLDGPTMIARVNAYDFKSHWIEFGTGNPGPTTAFAPLRRAADATGVKLYGGREGTVG